MALKKVTSINTSNVKQRILKDLIVDDNNAPIALEDMLGYQENGELNYIDLEGVNHYVHFEIEDLPHCCGLKEIGGLNKIDFMSQKAFNIMIKGLLTSDYTFIINTNGERFSKMWDEKLIKSKMFTCVKQFVNPSSKNLIKVWISNHIK